MNLNEENNDLNKENNPFSLPGDYFNSFSKKMMHKIELTDELKGFKLLSSLDKKLPFVTPDNYFDNKAELAPYPALSSVKKVNAFDTQLNYFETNVVTLQRHIEVLEELRQYPTLYCVSKKNSFVTPESYFNEASLRLLSNTKKPEGTVFGTVVSIVFSKKTAYAIAAMLVISLGLYFFNSKTETGDTGCNTLACLDRNDIIKANQINNFDDEALMEMVNAEELKKNINSNLKKEERKENTQQQTTQDYILENVDVNDLADEL